MRICFFGDSLVNGYGDPEYLGWVGRTAQYYRRQGVDLTCYNLGVRGQTSHDILQRWEREAAQRLLPEYPRAAVFSFGVNDTKIDAEKPRIDVQDSLRNAWDILYYASKKYPVLMIGPVAVSDEKHNERIELLSRELQQLCERIGVPYLNVFTSLLNSREWMDDIAAADGVHPGADGYRVLSSHIIGWDRFREFFGIS